MKYLLLLASIVTLSLGLPSNFEQISLNYHENIGIKEALRIRTAEESKDFDGSRIVGGTETYLGGHPYMGGLIISLTSSQTSVCGSTLISNTRLLTAAHCWFDGSNQAAQFLVVLASTTLFSGGTRVVATNVETHEDFNQLNLNNNIAIIEIPWINYTPLIQYISLASGSDTFEGQWARAVGYGRTGDNADITTNQALHQAWLQVIPIGVCAATYGADVVTSGTLCTSSAQGVNVCGGDVGGPLTLNGRLIGVTSFVSGSGCENGLPAGFTRVAAYDNWIKARL
uniref:Peptidase S1 domain-containing protein n=1 Tax=Pectinophora gossypiella TaxID=13191 RepID=A0A1E1WV21_PECGO